VAEITGTPMDEYNEAIGIDQKAIEAEAIGNMLNEAMSCDSLNHAVHKAITLVDNGYSIVEAANETSDSLNV